MSEKMTAKEAWDAALSFSRGVEVVTTDGVFDEWWNRRAPQGEPEVHANAVRARPAEPATDLLTREAVRELAALLAPFVGAAEGFVGTDHEDDSRVTFVQHYGTGAKVFGVRVGDLRRLREWWLARPAEPVGGGMTWTKDTPTQGGYYWTRTPRGHVEVVEVMKVEAAHDGSLWADDGLWCVDEVDNEWCGPIPEPLEVPHG
jgi:hypothetical protein